MELVKLIKYLDKKFNPKLASKWDKPGFQYLNKKIIDITKDINKVLVCLDVTNEVIDYAVKNDVKLLISRHPFIFNDLIEEKKIKKSMIDKLNKNNIDIYSIHTNFDASPNQNLLDLLKKEFNINKTKRFGSDNEGYQIKLKDKIKAKELVSKMDKIFNTGICQVSNNFKENEMFNEFYIVTGSGGGTMLEEKMENSFFVTGEIKWNELVYANDKNNYVLILGHYMEEYFVEYLHEIINNNFNKEIEVLKFDIKNQIRNIK